MNTNPELDEVDDFLSFWRKRSMEQMKKHRASRVKKMESNLSKNWDLLTDRKNINLSF